MEHELAFPAVEAATSPRIVSLLACATEIVSALGYGEALVARSHECDFPRTVAALPVVTESKAGTEPTSAAIDRQVRAVLEQGLSIYRVDAELLQSLEPDLIITQTQCEVCAVSAKDLDQALRQWTDRQPRIVSLAPNALADVWKDIETVAAALGAPERGAALVDRLRSRMSRVSAQALARSNRPRVACIEWIDPLMAAGNWMPELVAMAGGTNLFGIAGRHSPWMSWGELVAADPDVILVLPCGFGIARARQEMPVLTARREWSSLGAVRTGRVFLLDGNQFFNRPGPRLAESLEILAEILHPDAFAFGYRGVGWESFAPASRARHAQRDDAKAAHGAQTV